jgi:hypothetical protein
MKREIMIDSAVKAWLDNIIVPALVRQFCDETRTVGDNDLDGMSHMNSCILIAERLQ